ncbi:MAG: transcription-repair coupling factor [Acidobacteria bacterium]|nr:transcription-repair coupling factor [Acidobacteriota bacterium]
MQPILRSLVDFTARDRELLAALQGAGEAERRRVTIAGLNPAAAALLVSALAGRSPGGKVLLLVPGEKEAETFRADLSFALSALRGPAARVHLFPSLEADPYQELAPHLMVACERVQALRALREPGEAIVVAPTRALIYPLAPAPAFDVYRFDLGERQPLRPDDLSGFLLEAGYLRVDLVSTMGEFSRRGGIIDFLPPGGGPVRVEFWGEEVESLRTFDPGTQRSTGRLPSAAVPPVREYPWSPAALERLRAALESRRAAWKPPAARRHPFEKDDLLARIEALASGRTFGGMEACVRLAETRPASLFDYAPEALLVSWEEGQILSDLESVYVEMHASFDLSEDFGMPPPSDLLLPREVLEPRAKQARVRLSELALDEGRPLPLRVPCVPARPYKGRIQDLAADLKQAPPATATLFLMESPGRIERLREVLGEYDLPAAVVTEAGPPAPAAAAPAGGALPLAPAAPPLAPAAAPGLVIAAGRLSQGFTLPRIGLQILTEREVFGEHAEREARRPRVTAFSPGFRDLKVGDLVVHVEHGIGKYAGIARVGEDGSARDFMLLTYEAGDRLYVPIDRLDLVQRYSGVHGQKAKLDRLGGPGWERTKRKVRKAMREMAQDLLQLYAGRAAARGHAFSPDTAWQREFEDAFPYEETSDQEKAIRDVRADMEKDLPMDRLICGDVGFGKTEVAMRAAFKAVMEGKQVAVLCPTTVLAFQHLNTFRERFSSWPAAIEMISRFRSPREQKAVLVAVAAGKVDVLIGTHRLLSKDVKFGDLGLLVVDEEQRFGVAHKEAIKAMKKDVDVLTLTATPIPRTLQMSLAGIRDMSVIETPPENRLAIQTSIVPFRDGVIAAAIRHELKRGGQVYFVHNRVESIASMAGFIRKVVPEARLGVAHGRLGEGTLERTMIAFLNGEFDLLLATTIIENGLDIPRVNTIIVNRADRFGLAQLYQLRGRVGRSDRRAFAYLLVPARQGLTPVARRRLKALQEFSELGSGFRVAAMDLEIRGAGNLLGAEQSGHIAAVGFEMYCRLLEQTIREMKGEAPRPETRAQINLGVDIKIPEESIPDFNERLALYKRISTAPGEEELARIKDEIRDLYGGVPPQAVSLVALATLRLLADRLGVRTIDFSAGRVQVRFAEGTPVSPEGLVRLAAGRPGASLSPQGVLRLDLEGAAAAGVSAGTSRPAADLWRIEAVHDLLKSFGAGGSMRPASQPTAVGPPNGDR